ncbi:MAG: cobyric acid synthase CobQ [Deltaproteobacteria bacterium]|nr:MAG: cobyric acid synthase CobQ [Deltaproteobacteria bacterium]
MARRLLAQNILIRCCDNYRGLDEHFFRVAVRTEQENNQLLDALRTIFNKHQRISRPRKCPALMLQGTSSNAGKSVLCAAFCRILLQDGIQVAPFKAQNMSLNSFVTRDGREMGRAQVVQAQAARRDPDVRMNPVLLKPNSDTGSQIIVNGLPVGNMSVFDYSRYKSTVWQDVVASYHSLAAECDAIILEGAGSPGEVNLKKRDIVNMRMARHAEAPVLLVGDIDRGGVYASFVGTMEVLEQWERQLIAGFLVNRFRGQESLLASAHEYLFAHTGKKVFGVIPYLDDLGLPEEDSVSFKEGLFDTVARREDSVDIVLVDLPHISNFTDFESFLGEPDVTFRVVREPAEIGNPDALLLPGSKNVFADLKFLFDRGFAGIFHQKQREEQCEIVAICGGYQMLGREISDPLGIESSSPNMTGLGLLELTTELLAEKKLTRRQGVHLALGQEIAGYEIHHGISLSEGASCLRFNDGTSCGSVSANGLVWGCYLHGIFDNDLFRRSFLDRLRIRKGLEPINEVLVCYDLEAAFDRLAAVVRERVDMNFLYELMNL